MENRLKAVAEEYGHALQPLFMPGDAPPEGWIWDIVRQRPERYAATFGLAVPDMKKMADRMAHSSKEPSSSGMPPRPPWLPLPRKSSGLFLESPGSSASGRPSKTPFLSSWSL